MGDGGRSYGTPILAAGRASTRGEASAGGIHNPELCTSAGITGTKPIIAYCRIGERPSHSWFVSSYPLDYDNVSNYDGNWTEWGTWWRPRWKRGRRESLPGVVSLLCTVRSI